MAMPARTDSDEKPLLAGELISVPLDANMGDFRTNSRKQGGQST